MFERGMDPMIDNPEVCHPHSPLPAKWPEPSKILRYRQDVINKMKRILSDGANMNQVLHKALNMCYEHEAMHLETLIYMAVQTNLTPCIKLPLPLLEVQDIAMESGWTKILAGTVTLGLNDSDELMCKGFGWDNEFPATEAAFPDFTIQNRPVTVHEYFTYLEQQCLDEDLPASWSHVGGSWFVKSIYGLIPFKYAMNWPVYCSHDQATKYASFNGCILPSEVQIVYLRKKSELNKSSKGFQHLLPQNVNQDTETITDVCSNGWEITSTIFAPFPGFTSSDMYPGYSADFL